MSNICRERERISATTDGVEQLRFVKGEKV
jgi:hypothetical protein